jgi:hypothetical protein
MQSPAYRVAARELLDQAWFELDAGDVRQASEKGWGAAAQMVKAISEQRGWHHRGHALLYDAVGKLSDETDDQRIAELFDVANSLHINFYENWRDAQSVSRALGNVKTFLDKLEPLIDSI